MTSQELIRELKIILWFGGDEKAYKKYEKACKKKRSRKWRFMQGVDEHGKLHWKFE